MIRMARENSQENKYSASIEALYTEINFKADVSKVNCPEYNLDLKIRKSYTNSLCKLFK